MSRTVSEPTEPVITKPAPVEPVPAPAVSAQDVRLCDALVDHAGDAIIGIDRRGLVTVWNRKAAELFGFLAQDAIGKDVEFIIPERLRSAHHRGFSAAMASGHLRSDGRARRTKALTRDGSTIFVEMTFAVVTDADGQAIGSVAVARKPIGDA